MKQKVISIEQAVDMVYDGMSIMVGGFLGCGNPNKIIDALVEKQVKNLTIICNDAAFPGRGVGKLFDNKQVDLLICSHIGTNPEVGRQMTQGETTVDLRPQGTLAEQMRCAGSGLGGFLTPTGVGTMVAEGKQVVNVDGKEYLLELPLKADLAILYGYKVDKQGNVFYKQSTQNFQPIMAIAADLVIVEADNVVEVGEIEPESIHTPSIFVDYIVDGGAL